MVLGQMSWPSFGLPFRLSTYRAVLLLGLITSVVLIFQGGYMQAKAHFAQFLIEQAWQKTLEDRMPHKPWSWADTHPIAELSVDMINSTGNSKRSMEEKMHKLYVLAGASGRNLAFGPALLLNGARPGSQGNTVIAGHRDSHFSFLQYLTRGQILNLTNKRGEKLIYQIDSLQIVHQSQIEVMEQNETEELTLITCYPFNQISGGAQLRYVVKARRMDTHSSL